MLACAGIFVFSGCSKVREVTPPGTSGPIDTTHLTYNKGIFIINEGNFTWANASVTYIAGKSDSVYQDIYQAANDKALGDVAQSMNIIGNKGFIVVNNSNKVEVVSLTNFKSLATITGFNSPRYIEFVDSTKAYVTNMQKNISVVDLRKNVISKTIATPYWTEGLCHFGNYMFVTCIGSFNQSTADRKSQVYIVDTRSDIIVDSMAMGKEPVSIAVDRKNKIWVLCTGGYNNYEPPSIKRIDPALMIVEKTFNFPVQQGVPSRLCINSTGDTLYFINGGVFQMSVSSAELPATALIPANGHLFYGLGIDPNTGEVYVSDAVNYTQNGYVYRCSQSTGQVLRTFTAGHIPGSFCFESFSRK